MAVKIKKIEIHNYRSCGSTTFEPNPQLSALIGPNGSGKTNILLAIKLLVSLLDVPRGYFRNANQITSRSKLKIWYDVDGKRIIHTIKLGIFTDEKNYDEIIQADESWYMYDFTGNKKLLKLPLEGLISTLSNKRRNFNRIFYYQNIDKIYRDYLHGGIQKSVRKPLSEIIRFICSVKYYSASQFTNPSNCPISFYDEKARTKSRTTTITGHEKLLFDIFDEYKQKTENYKVFSQLIQTPSLGLVDEISFGEIEISTPNYQVTPGAKYKKKETTRTLVIPSFLIGKNSLSPSQLSEGTFKTLALIFYLVTDKSSLIMLEEPEVCVHHGLLESIIELLKIYSSEKQIIISTHSDLILDDLDISNIYKVSREDKYGTKVAGLKKSIKGKDLAALKHFLHNEGSLGEFWKHGDLEDV